MTDEPPIRPLTAWEHYRRTLVFTQLFILSMCAAMMYFTKMPIGMVVVMFFSLQVFGFLGAVWGARLSRRIAAKGDELPLSRKRRRLGR